MLQGSPLVPLCCSAVSIGAYTLRKSLQDAEAQASQTLAMRRFYVAEDDQQDLYPLLRSLASWSLRQSGCRSVQFYHNNNEVVCLEEWPDPRGLLAAYAGNSVRVSEDRKTALQEESGTVMITTTKQESDGSVITDLHKILAQGRRHGFDLMPRFFATIDYWLPRKKTKSLGSSSLQSHPPPTE